MLKSCKLKVFSVTLPRYFARCKKRLVGRTVHFGVTWAYDNYYGVASGIAMLAFKFIFSFDEIYNLLPLGGYVLFNVDILF